MPLFVVVAGESDASVFPLEAERCVIGKAPHADIQLSSPFISRAHAEVTAIDRRHSLRDLGSKNGTSLNGRPVGPVGAWLSEGDRVELAQGKVVLRYQSGTSTITIVDLDSRDDPFRVDMASREAYVGGVRVEPPLARKEFDVLAFLYEHRGTACSKDAIAEAGWPEREGGDVGDGEIEQCIRRIRLRIEPDPSNPHIVKVVKGFGYKIDAPSE